MNAPIRLILAALSLLLAVPAAALTIDNFEEGDFVVVDTSAVAGATSGEQSGLLTSNVVGGVRLARAEGFGPVTTATSTLVTTGGDDGVLLDSLGAVNPVVGDFQFIYDGIANNQSDGANGALGLDLSAFTRVTVGVSSLTGAATGQLTLWSSARSASSPLLALANGTNTFLLSVGFGTLNLADIQAIRLFVQGVNNLDIVTVTDITAVPEPGTGLLIAAGMIALALRRRQR